MIMEFTSRHPSVISGTFSVWHRNGRPGNLTNWMRDQNELSFDAARILAQTIRQRAHDGYYAEVEIFSDEINPNRGEN
jgi:hypothetical protein